MTVKKYDKLVRDRIPQIIRDSGKDCVCTVLSEADYLTMLEKKLQEELNEYLESRDPEELADLMEVIRACARAIGSSIGQVEEIRARKEEKRGGFEKRICLETVWDHEEAGR